jgi:hypothetical protein
MAIKFLDSEILAANYLRHQSEKEDQTITLRGQHVPSIHVTRRKRPRMKRKQQTSSPLHQAPAGTHAGPLMIITNLFITKYMFKLHNQLVYLLRS